MVSWVCLRGRIDPSALLEGGEVTSELKSPNRPLHSRLGVNECNQDFSPITAKAVRLALVYVPVLKTSPQAILIQRTQVELRTMCRELVAAKGARKLATSRLRAELGMLPRKSKIAAILAASGQISGLRIVKEDSYPDRHSTTLWERTAR